MPASEACLKAFLKRDGSCRINRIKRISIKENFQDNFLLVLNDLDQYPLIREYLLTIDDSHLLQQLASQATTDKTWGNFKIDFGSACWQNLVQNPTSFGNTQPCPLANTQEDIFREVQKELSCIVDLVCESFNLLRYYRVDNFLYRFCQQIHPQGIIPAWRVAFNRPDQVLQVHEDSNNESRHLMSPVGVFSQILQTNDGPLRLTKIGYSRKSLYDSTLRESIIQPIVQDFFTWEAGQPDLLKFCSSELFRLKPNSSLPHVIWNVLLVCLLISMLLSSYKNCYRLIVMNAPLFCTTALQMNYHIISSPFMKRSRSPLLPFRIPCQRCHLSI
jgi:hypothetical protein